jgi:glycosyltransferase involved in cell wall biosynthesis
MTSVLMFPMLPEKNASSRVVCYQYKRHLEDLGVRVEISPPSSTRLYEVFEEVTQEPDPNLAKWRLLLLRIARKLMHEFYWHVLVLPKRLVDLCKCRNYDVIFIQRMMFKYDSLPFLERLVRRLNPRIIYNFDDAIYLRLPHQTAQRIALAKAVMTGREILAAFARQHNDNVTIIESTVDTQDHYRTKSSYAASGPLVIGWAGNPRNLSSLYLIEDALSQLVERGEDFVLRVICSEPPHFSNKQIPVEFVEWSLEREVDTLLALDIGIMPIPDDEYARGKEGYKIKQYMACGLPVVCSPIGKNAELVQPNETGLWATDQAEWVDALSRLMQSGALRERLGKAGHAFIVEHYDVRQAAIKYQKLIQQVAAL